MPQTGAGFPPWVPGRDVSQCHLSGWALSQPQAAQSDRSLLRVHLGPCCEKESPGEHFHKRQNSLKLSHPVQLLNPNSSKWESRGLRLRDLPDLPGTPRAAASAAEVGPWMSSLLGPWFQVKSSQTMRMPRAQKEWHFVSSWPPEHGDLSRHVGLRLSLSRE